MNGCRNEDCSGGANVYYSMNHAFELVGPPTDIFSMWMQLLTTEPAPGHDGRGNSITFACLSGQAQNFRTGVVVAFSRDADTIELWREHPGAKYGAKAMPAWIDKTRFPTRNMPEHKGN